MWWKIFAFLWIAKHYWTMSSGHWHTCNKTAFGRFQQICPSSIPVSNFLHKVIIGYTLPEQRPWLTLVPGSPKQPLVQKMFYAYLGKPHVRILCVQPEFCRKGGGVEIRCQMDCGSSSVNMNHY